MNFPRVLQKPKMSISLSASKVSVKYFLKWYKQLESMPGYKYPYIDSGVTPSGSASRAPDKKTNFENEFDKKR
jgi:hypothetical protein